MSKRSHGVGVALRRIQEATGASHTQALRYRALVSLPGAPQKLLEEPQTLWTLHSLDEPSPLVILSLPSGTTVSYQHEEQWESLKNVLQAGGEPARVAPATEASLEAELRERAKLLAVGASLKQCLRVLEVGALSRLERERALSRQEDGALTPLARADLLGVSVVALLPAGSPPPPWTPPATIALTYQRATGEAPAFRIQGKPRVPQETPTALPPSPAPLLGSMGAAPQPAPPL